MLLHSFIHLSLPLSSSPSLPLSLSFSVCTRTPLAGRLSFSITNLIAHSAVTRPHYALITHMLFCTNISIWVPLRGNCSTGTAV